MQARNTFPDQSFHLAISPWALEEIIFDFTYILSKPIWQLWVVCTNCRRWHPWSQYCFNQFLFPTIFSSKQITNVLLTFVKIDRESIKHSRLRQSILTCQTWLPYRIRVLSRTHSWLEHWYSCRFLGRLNYRWQSL